MNPVRFASGLVLSALLVVPAAAGAFTLFDTDDPEANPDVAFVPAATPGASGVYLLTWERQLSGSNTDIFAALLDEAGTQTGSDIHLSSDPAWERRPAVASNGYDEFLVVFERDDGSSNHDIYGQRVSSSGVLQGSAFQISTDSRDETQPSVAYDNTYGEYVVVWEHAYSATDHDIRGRVVSGVGVPGDAFVVAYTEKTEGMPVIAADVNSSGFLVTYDHQYSASDCDVHARPLTVDASLSVALGTTFVVANTGHDEQSASVAGSYGGEYYVAYHFDDGTYDQIRGQRANASGMLGSNVRLRQASLNSNPYPDVMAHGTGGWLVVWEDDLILSDIVAQEISVYGLVDGMETTLSWNMKRQITPAVPAIATVTHPLVVWSRLYTYSDPDLHGALVP